METKNDLYVYQTASDGRFARWLTTHFEKWSNPHCMVVMNRHKSITMFHVRRLQNTPEAIDSAERMSKEARQYALGVSAGIEVVYQDSMERGVV